jgi:hypothetical protein
MVVIKKFRPAVFFISLLVQGCMSTPPYLGTKDLVGACNVGNIAGKPEEDSYLEPALYAACYTYLAASVDAVYAGAADLNEETSLPAVCMPDRRPSLDKTREIFMRYLQDNPDRAEDLSHSAPYLAVVEALSQAYPCTEEKFPVFHDVATIKGSTSDVDGARQICIVQSIDNRNWLYGNEESTIESKLTSLFYVNPGLRKLDVRCEVWRNNLLVQKYSGSISFIAEPLINYEPVHLPKESDSSIHCLYIRNTKTQDLVASSCQ